MKKFIALLQCIAMLWTTNFLCKEVAYATENTFSKTVYINVAQNKPVTVSEEFIQETAAYPLFTPPKMTDGKITTCALGTFPADSYIQVDLQRKYPVKEITLTDRYDVDHPAARTNLSILASNDADFTTCDILDTIGAAADVKFTHGGKWHINLDGSKYYRYIRIQNNETSYGGFGELQVFSEQTVTQLPVISAEASRETTSQNYTYSASRAIDSRNENASDAWVADGADIYHFLKLTIPENKHIGMVEIEDRYNNGNSTTRQADVFYGSNSYIDRDTAITLSTFENFSEYTYLGTTGHYGDYPTGEVYPYPPYPEGMYRATFNNETAFQYFTMKKDYPLSATVGEIRLFEINPNIISVKTDPENKTIIVEFTDEMDFSTAEADTFTLSDGTNTFNVSGTALDSYTYILNGNNLAKEKSYTLKISTALKSKKNTGLAENYLCTGIRLDKYSCNGIKLFDPKTPNSEVDLYNCDTITASAEITNNTKEDTDFYLIYVHYDSGNNIIETQVATKGISSKLSDTISLTRALSYQPGDTIRTFLWDEALTPVTDIKHLTTPYRDIYVSPNGNDKNSGTEDAPVATIQRAQEIVRNLNHSMTDDINVFIADGIYPQEKTLSFSTRDSGTNGKTIKYIGSNNTVISGGKQVTGFTKVNDNGLYCADVDTDTIRELYVNGKKAIRAQSEQKIKPISVYEENGVRAGFVISQSQFAAYQNPQDIQFHYQRSWRSLVLNVSSIEANADNYIVRMQQPAFSYASAPLGEGYAFWVDETNGFYIENAFELLDRENEFYYDKTAKKLYYLTTQTDMQTAKVYVPVLEQLMTVTGDDLNHKVRNISFENITFAHTTFKMTDNGYLGDQAQRYEILQAPKTAYPLDSNIVGANIRISIADNITISNNEFFGMGAVALGLYDGSANCNITGNVFYDINDSAITVGLPSDAYMQTDANKGNEVALYKPTTATYNTSHYWSCYVNDGNADTGWTMGTGDNNLYTDEYWQVDLEKQYTISSIVIKARKGYDQQNTRRNFEILGSNDENFKEGSYSVLATQGSEAFSITDGFSSEVSDPQKYRYIRIRKTVNEYFYLADVEIYTKDEVFTPKKEVCKNNLIQNNYITNIGLYNVGAPGIQTYYTEGLNISNNTIRNVPYSGIALGWGWTQTPDSVTSKNNVISQNLIDTYNTVNFDGGGIYTLGQQPGSIISGNYIKNQINGHAAFYPDSGSSQYSFTGNVIEDSDIPFFVYGPQTNLSINANYANSQNTTYHKGTDCTIEAPVFYVPGKESEAILSIKNKAGLQEAYQMLLSVPYEKEIITTDIEYNYGNAIDENKWNIGALQDPKFLEIYFQYLIDYANDLYATASVFTDYFTTKYRNLQSAIRTAESAYKTAKNQITYATYDSETGLYATNEGMTMNRTAVIEAKLKLQEAIDTFLQLN